MAALNQGAGNALRVTIAVRRDGAGDLAAGWVVLVVDRTSVTRVASEAGVAAAGGAGHVAVRVTVVGAIRGPGAGTRTTSAVVLVAASTVAAVASCEVVLAAAAAASTPA